MIRDLGDALDYRKRFSEFGVQFEVVGIHLCESRAHFEQVRIMKNYIGLDVSLLCGQSALHPAGLPTPIDEGPAHLLPLWRLERAYFVPRLNRYGLLDSFDDAMLLRDFTRTLGKIAPEEHEPEYVDTEVLGITYEFHSGEK